MPLSRLKKALESVSWDNHIKYFLKQDVPSNMIAESNFRLAIWSKQFEVADLGNPALAFIREMQVSGYYVASLASLAHYKPAASAMRNVLETALYYTYFRSHPSELATLIRDSSFFVFKQDLTDYHLKHTPEFKKNQECFDLIKRLNDWYRKVSSIVHGQIPGGWGGHKSLEEIKHKKDTLVSVANTFKEGEKIVHHLFLCTAGRELWDEFSAPYKKQLLKGLSGSIKSTLELDLI